MVDDLRRKGIRDPRVLEAFAQVPRERFVPSDHRGLAYVDGPLPIGLGQTISQPYMVAAMTEALALEGGERVLEIGTGSGYQAAILSRLAREVVTIERHAPLSGHAAQVLRELECHNVTCLVGDGTLGAGSGPYDAIVVTAGAPLAPLPLLAQLNAGGRLVIPVGDRGIQTLERYRRAGDEFLRERLMDCMFVPLIGEHGWKS
ncbi:MAG: protein-L-isoaspartate(D-aspartate) O-methyltransferase [Nitrospirota bacterium]|nr:protein-L-isoaspartate(D-aspartate) O-methyltransferase [Nitrospirota bacterium]